MQHFNSIALDITNHCNARCRFCLSRWRSPQNNMTFDTFKKIVLYAPPYVKDFIFLSCLYEPTVHPQFAEFMQILPAKYKDKFFFTTNLVKKFTSNFFEELATINVRHINISLETFDRQLYDNLSRTKNSHFYENIDKLHSAFKRAKCPPKLRFITMILNDNCNELVEIAKKVHDMPNLESHEFRTPFHSPQIPKDYMIQQSIPASKLAAIKEKILLLGYSNTSVYDANSLESAYEYLKNCDSSSHPMFPVDQLYCENGEQTFDEADPCGCEGMARVSASGYFFIDELQRIYDISTAENPDLFFHTILSKVSEKKHDEMKMRLQNLKIKLDFNDNNATQGWIDSSIPNLKGWIASQTGKIVTCECVTKQISITGEYGHLRPDVQGGLGDSFVDSIHSGFMFPDLSEARSLCLQVTFEDGHKCTSQPIGLPCVNM